MLVSFSVENFMSFKDRCKLSLISGRGIKHKDHVVTSSKTTGFNILKTSIIYGANASGKSNLIKAMDYAREIIVYGNDSKHKIAYKPFKFDTTKASEPSRVEFEIKVSDKYYAYGFMVDSRGVVEEWLYDINKKRDKRVFDRVRKNDEYVYQYDGIKFHNKEDEQYFKFTTKGVPSNKLLLTDFEERRVINEINYLHDFTSVYDWFDKTLNIVFPNSKYSGLELHLAKSKNRERISRLLKSFDTGINEVSTERVSFEDAGLGIPENVKKEIFESLNDETSVLVSGANGSRFALTKKDDKVDVHKLVASHLNEKDEIVYMDVNQESDGTQRILDMAPGLMDVVQNPKVYIIDELDRSLHPDVTRSIVKGFLSNTAGDESQLIVSTHETNLLDQDLIRTDEVWFVQKDKCGSSDLYSLKEFKPRFDKDIRTGYLSGRFGGIPLLNHCEADWIE